MMHRVNVALTPHEAAVATELASEKGITMEKFIQDFVHTLLRPGDKPPAAPSEHPVRAQGALTFAQGDLSPVGV